MQSVNSLKDIYPEDMIEWLELSLVEVKEVIEYLHDDRVLSYKYKIRCGCGENSTIYERKLIQDKSFFCSICGKEYTKDKVAEEAEIVYEIDKEELLNIGAESIDFREQVNNILRIVPLKVVDGKDASKMEKKKIFIGSSTTVITKMEEIARIIDDLGGEALPWNAKGKGVFVAGQYTFESLIKVANEVDGAIFMFNAEDTTWYSDKCQLNKEVRDNVLLEYGLFCGILGKDKVTFICNGEPKIATDLLGVTYINGEQSEYQIKPEINDWLVQV